MYEQQKLSEILRDFYATVGLEASGGIYIDLCG